MIDVEDDTPTYGERHALVDWGILLGTLDARCRAVGELPHFVRMGKVYDTLYTLRMYEVFMKEHGIEPPVAELPDPMRKLRELGFTLMAARYNDPEIEKQFREHILEFWR